MMFRVSHLLSRGVEHRSLTISLSLDFVRHILNSKTRTSYGRSGQGRQKLPYGYPVPNTNDPDHQAGSLEMLKELPCWEVRSSVYLCDTRATIPITTRDHDRRGQVMKHQSDPPCLL